MLSEDFAYAWEERRPWEEFYKEEIVNNEMYKTLFFKYKDRFYQFEPTGFKRGETFNGKEIKLESYLFLSFTSKDGYLKAFYDATCYDSFKDAVDNARMDGGKTLKEIWDDPAAEYLDFA